MQVRCHTTATYRIPGATPGQTVTVTINEAAETPEKIKNSGPILEEDGAAITVRVRQRARSIARNSLGHGGPAIMVTCCMVITVCPQNVDTSALVEITRGTSLFFIGNDFTHTDIPQAL